MSTSDIWHLHFNLTEFTPREVESITTLSTVMQRDWRHRGFLAKSDKHARFTMITLAEAWVMKMFADRGVGPARSHPVARLIAVAILMEVLSFREEAWGGASPAEAFGAIPKTTRNLTLEEQDVIEYRAFMTPWLRWQDTEPREGLDRSIALGMFDRWAAMGHRVLTALGIEEVDTSRHVIWWPNDEVVLGDYDLLTEDPHFDREGPDPRYDGVALVLGIGAAAANLARRLPRPLVSVALEVFDPAPGRLFWADHGKTAITSGEAAYSALLAKLGSTIKVGRSTRKGAVE